MQPLARGMLSCLVRVGFRVQDTWAGHWPGVCSHGVVRVGV